MSRSKTLVTILCICIFASAAHAGKAAKEFFLKGGERIVFYGDSITQNGGYIEYVETFLLTRFPSEKFEVINRGISSETLSGTSEIDHNPPRPDAHKRFSRDITPLKPDVLVSCFGMNDGNYHPFSEKLFAKYKAGVERLIKRAAEEAKATAVIMTPPPFDPYRKKISDSDAVHWGYKYSYIGYDDVLERYSRWLLGFRENGMIVADVHSAMNKHLARRREKKVSFYLSGDGVHPNPTGHWLMAQTLLLAWNAPSQAGSLEIDTGGKKIARGDVTSLSVRDGIIEFTWRTGLPMPIDAQWDAESIELEEVGKRLNKHQIKMTSLRAGRYQLYANGQLIGEVGREQLAEGLDLLGQAKFPTVMQSQEVLKLVQQRQRLLYKTWRQSIKSSDEELPAKVAEQAAELDAKARQLCQPKLIAIRLVPAPGRSEISNLKFEISD